MGWIKWGLVGLAIFVASGAVALGIVSTGGDTASAQTPGKHGLGNYEQALAGKLGISVDKLRAAQKSAREELSSQNPGQRNMGAWEQALAEELGINVPILQVAQKAAFEQMINDAVAAGRLTPEQAERLKSMGARGAGPGFPGGGRPFAGRMREGFVHAVKSVLSAAAGVIGISEDDLKDELRGKSLAEIADDNGVDRDELKEGLIEELEDAIEKAQADGKITKEQADRLTKGLNEHIDQIIDHEGGMKGRGMRPFMAPGGPRFGPMPNQN